MSFICLYRILKLLNMLLILSIIHWYILFKHVCVMKINLITIFAKKYINLNKFIMKNDFRLFCSTIILELSSVSMLSAKDDIRPNILWLTFEDTSAYEFGCYGNKDVSTPNVDSLAQRGVQFMNAWSVGPQSSPARSSLITGCYAPTYGMDFHPVPFDTPEDIFFPQRLREAGYYCTNNNKTHYNTTTDNKSCWDECNKKASYNSPKRKDGQPFFAVFNTVTSHMGRIRTFHTDGRRDYTREGIYPQLLTLPSYVPDLPEVRSDYAGHLEAVQDVDKWVKIYLDDLKEKGLDENTIIFFFSDHGGCVPRGKGYLFESGLRVPLVVYFPEKFKHLANGLSGKVDRLVNFTDLGPTVLSLAGVKPEKRMQGEAVFGKYAAKEERKLNFAFASNQLHHFMPVRAVSDGRYKYIRSYMPYRQFALRNYYQWGMPSNKAWDKLVLGGHNTNDDWAQTFCAHPAEMLFDLFNDPGEIHDLSSLPQYQDILNKMRESLSSHIRETEDLGFFLPTSRRGKILYNSVREEKFPLNELYNLVELASMPKSSDEQFFRKALISDYPEMKFWATVGYAQLAKLGLISECPEELRHLINDSDPYISSEAAYAISYLGYPEEGIKNLVYPVKEENRKIGYSSLECLSLDPNMRKYIREYLNELRNNAETLPRIQNEDAGLMARGILVNLGELDIDLLHGEEAYKAGLKLNYGRRKIVPLPY